MVLLALEREQRLEDRRAKARAFSLHPRATCVALARSAGGSRCSQWQLYVPGSTGSSRTDLIGRLASVSKQFTAAFSIVSACSYDPPARRRQMFSA